MQEPRLRGVLHLDLPDGWHVGILQPDGPRWRTRCLPWQAGSPWDDRQAPVETLPPDVEAARAWLLAQLRPPALDDLVPGAERLGG